MDERCQQPAKVDDWAHQNGVYWRDTPHPCIYQQVRIVENIIFYYVYLIGAIAQNHATEFPAWLQGDVNQQPSRAAL